MSRRTFFVVGLMVAVMLAFLVSPHASSSPDGLIKVAAETGLDSQLSDHALGNGPLAGYSMIGVDDEGLSTGLAGVIGISITFGAAFGLSKLTKTAKSRVAITTVAT